MKTSNDPRHKKRQEVVKILFAQSFLHQPYKNLIVDDITKNLPEIDRIIERLAPEFPIDKINKVDLAILRLGVYEMTIEKKEPSKVVIDESIELAKELGGDSSPVFINGALGKLMKEESHADTQNK